MYYTCSLTIALLRSKTVIFVQQAFHPSLFPPSGTECCQLSIRCDIYCSEAPSHGLFLFLLLPTFFFLSHIQYVLYENPFIDTLHTAAIFWGLEP